MRQRYIVAEKLDDGNVKYVRDAEGWLREFPGPAEAKRFMENQGWAGEEHVHFIENNYPYAELTTRNLVQGLAAIAVSLAVNRGLLACHVKVAESFKGWNRRQDIDVVQERVREAGEAISSLRELAESRALETFLAENDWEVRGEADQEGKRLIAIMAGQLKKQYWVLLVMTGYEELNGPFDNVETREKQARRFAAIYGGQCKVVRLASYGGLEKEAKPRIPAMLQRELIPQAI